MTTSDNHRQLNGKILVPFIAPPNGGKGTQTKVISAKYGLPTFDMGATFRSILKENADPVLASELKFYMSQGKLVPVKTVLQVFTKGFTTLVDKHPQARGFILDGFPRNADQAKGLLTLCEEWGASMPTVIYLNVGLDVVTQRSTGRRFCSLDTSHLYNIYAPKFKPKNKRIGGDGQPVKDAQEREVWVCDLDGNDLIVRADDEPDTVQKRLVEYENETNPIISFFADQKLLAEINGDQQPEIITGEIEAVLQKFIQPLASAKA